MSKTGFFKLRLIKSNSKLFINLQNWKFEGLWLYTPCSNTTIMGVGTWNVGTNRKLALWVLRGVPWHWVRHNVWGFSSCSQRFDMSDVQICEYGCRTNYNWRISVWTNLSISTRLLENLLSFCIHASGWIVGGKNCSVWALVIGEGAREAGATSSVPIVVAESTKSLSLSLSIFFSRKMDAAQTTLWTHVMHSMVL